MKDKNVAAILALFLGGLGVHKFYLGRIGVGVVYLLLCLTPIPWVLGLVDFFILALMDSDAFHRRFNGSHELPPQVIVNMLPPGYPGYPGAPYGYGYGGNQGYGGQPGWGTGPYGQVPGPYGPGPAAAPPALPPLSPDELATQLEKLNELRISGILTEDEFQAQKSKLLARV